MIVVKLGGSIIQSSFGEMNPNVIDLVKKFDQIDDSVSITMGGGKLCRLYQDGLRANGIHEDAALHVLGVQSCNFQAEYLRCIFPKQTTFPDIVKFESEADIARISSARDKYKYFICGAWSPGKSSDYNAALTATEFNTKTLLRISNIDYVYDDDPRVNPNASKKEKLTWDEYLAIIGNITEHRPGASYPVDPICARFARDNNLKFYFTSFEKFLTMDKVDLNKFDGTVIG